MAQFGDLMRHDRAGKHLHSSKCKAIGIETTRGHARTHTYIHTHKPVCEHGDGRMLWNQEAEVTTNRPDI
jgi:hypothetical protein